MLIASSRSDFTDPDRLLDSGHLYADVDLAGGEVQRLDGFEDVAKVINDARVLLLVHGYNNEHEEVLDAYRTVQENVGSHLRAQYDHVLGYSWPGGDYGWEWTQAKSRANAVATRFWRLTEELSQSARSLDVMSHSLGARVVLKALKAVQAQTTPVRNYFCLAAAVDNEALETGKEFTGSRRGAESIFVLHSNKDKVLSIAYRFREFDRALGLSGPEDRVYIEKETPNVFVLNCKRQVERHGGYKGCEGVYRYMSTALAGSVDRYAAL